MKCCKKFVEFTDVNLSSYESVIKLNIGTASFRVVALSAALSVAPSLVPAVLPFVAAFVLPSASVGLHLVLPCLSGGLALLFSRDLDTLGDLGHLSLDAVAALLSSIEHVSEAVANRFSVDTRRDLGSIILEGGHHGLEATFALKLLLHGCELAWHGQFAFLTHEVSISVALFFTPFLVVLSGELADLCEHLRLLLAFLGHHRFGLLEFLGCSLLILGVIELAPASLLSFAALTALASAATATNVLQHSGGSFQVLSKSEAVDIPEEGVL